MTNRTIMIYVWPDRSWVSEEDVDDLDWYIASTGKSDDFSIHDVPLDLEADDIEELISMDALPGMLPEVTTLKIEQMGKVSIPEGAILMVHHSKDIEYNAVTMLKDKLIVNAPGIMVEVIMPKEETDE